MAISSCLVDTNVLLRTARRNDPQHKLATSAVAKLASENTILHYTHQNIAEVWNAMTRPVSLNGFGLAIEKAEREVRVVEAGMTLLPDSEATYREGRGLIVRHGVSGVQVHDARLVGTMRVHGVRHILTLNAGDFRRYSGIVVLNPENI